MKIAYEINRSLVVSHRAFILALVLGLFVHFNVYAADINEQLFKAAQSSDHSGVKRLIAKGADVNYRNHLGMTALIVASRDGHFDVAKTLLEYSADMLVRSSSGLYAEIVPQPDSTVEVTPTQQGSAAKFSKPATVRYGRLYGETALIMAAQSGHDDIVKLLLEKGAPIESRTSDYKSALLKAAEEGHLAVVELLLFHGADINVSTSRGTPVVMVAARQGYVDIVTALLTHGVDVNYQSKYYPKDTLLIMAAKDGHDGVVEALLKNGANVDAHNESNKTALLVAAEEGHTDVVRALLKYGASTNIKSNSGYTALRYAKMMRHNEIAKLISARAAKDRKLPRKEVRFVQSRLNELGYDAGAPDGLMGQQTRTAIRTYQKSAGLPPTGMITSELIAKLKNKNTE